MPINVTHITLIKSFTKKLNNTFPAKPIIHENWYNGKVFERTVISVRNHFYASYANGVCIIHIGDYWLHSDTNVQHHIRLMRKAAIAEGLRVQSRYFYKAMLQVEKERCISKGEIFIL